MCSGRRRGGQECYRITREEPLGHSLGGAISRGRVSSLGHAPRDELSRGGRLEEFWGSPLSHSSCPFQKDQEGRPMDLHHQGLHVTKGDPGLVGFHGVYQRRCWEVSFRRRSGSSAFCRDGGEIFLLILIYFLSLFSFLSLLSLFSLVSFSILSFLVLLFFLFSFYIELFFSHCLSTSLSLSVLSFVLLISMF